MAESGVADEGDQWERIRMIRRVRELFHGRFTEHNAHTLLRHHNWELSATVTFALDASPASLRQVLTENDWETVTYVRRNAVLADLARRDQVGSEARQFACLDCSNMWWRIVPTRKLVSRCNRCKGKYDAVPRDEEWGWARFQCPQPCGNEYYAFGAMAVSRLRSDLHGKSKSICYSCLAHLCEPIEIIQPYARERRRGSRNTHWCTADNCYNRQRDDLMPRRRQGPGNRNRGWRQSGNFDFSNGAPLPKVPICVHPLSLRKDVINPSTRHASSGSTVNTFLSQSALAPPYSPYEPSLSPIDGPDNDGDNM